jgi:hypothetical protein
VNGIGGIAPVPAVTQSADFTGKRSKFLNGNPVTGVRGVIQDTPQKNREAMTFWQDLRSNPVDGFILPEIAMSEDHLRVKARLVALPCAKSGPDLFLMGLA